MFGFGKTKVELHSPFPGKVVSMDEVPDPMFSQRMLGDGFAVIPDESVETIEVTAPASGKLAKVFGTRHAFALVTDDGGLEILVHIGLETVDLGGKGFEALAETNDHVEAGQPVIRVDAAAVRAAGCPLITPVVLTKPAQVGDLKVSTGSTTNGSVASVTLS